MRVFLRIVLGFVLWFRSGVLGTSASSHQIAIAWGGKTLKNFTGFTEAQIAALSSFNSQATLLVPSNYTTIWDYFPVSNSSQFSLTTGPVMQDPQEQDPSALAATACDSCLGPADQPLVNMSANSSDWGVIWTHTRQAYKSLLGDENVSEDDGSTTFKMAMNWYTSTKSSPSMLGNETQRSGALCSTIYLEGLTGMSAANEEEILTVLPTHFQDMAAECGCGIENLGPGSAGSPFRGGWKVIMKGRAEAWRFRIESPGTGCVAEGADTG